MFERVVEWECSCLDGLWYEGSVHVWTGCGMGVWMFGRVVVWECEYLDGLWYEGCVQVLTRWW